MKTSDLIKELSVIERHFGDLPVMISIKDQSTVVSPGFIVVEEYDEMGKEVQIRDWPY